MDEEEIDELVTLIDNENFEDDEFEADQDDYKEAGNYDETELSSSSPKTARIRRMQTKAILLKHKDKKPTAHDLAKKTTKLSEAKRFRTVKLLSKTKMTAADCQRPIVLLEFDFPVKGLIAAGDYVLLHHVDNETITRAYTPINPEFILCDGGDAWLREE